MEMELLHNGQVEVFTLTFSDSKTSRFVWQI